MNIYKWKASKIHVESIANVIYMRGMLEVICTDGNTYKIPYGAEDSEYQLAYEKCISEMCERATWFSLYTQFPKLFHDTSGFSSHTDINFAYLNSKREYIENNLVEFFLSKLSEGYEEIIKYFTVIRKTQEINIVYSTGDTDHVFSFCYKHLDNGADGFIFGLGKSASIKKSYIHSINECRLVEKAMNNVIGREKKENPNSLVDLEIRKYFSIFYNQNLKKLFFSLQEGTYYSEGSRFIIDYDFVDVSNNIPEFLRHLNRKVIYCCATDKKKTINFKSF